MADQVLQNGGIVFRNVVTGQLGTVAPEDAQKFEKNPDFRAVTAAEFAQSQQEAELAKRQTLGAKVETGLRGAAEAVGDVAALGAKAIVAASGRPIVPQTAGLPAQLAAATSADPASAAAQYEAETRALQSANPGAYTAGNVAGNVALGLATGGAVSAAGKGLASGLARYGIGQGTASALGTGVAMAGEGALYGAAQAEGDAIRAGQSDGATAEQMLQSIGLSSLMGFGLGAAVGGGGSVFRKIFGKSDDVAPSPPTSLRAATEEQAAAVSVPRDRIANLYNELASSVSGAEKATLEKYGILSGGKEAIEGRALYRARGELIDNATTEATSAIQKLDQAVEKITSHVREADMKVSGVGKMMSEDGLTPSAVRSTARREINDGLSKLREMYDAIPENEYSKHVRADLRRAIDFGESRFGAITPESSGEAAYVAVDQFKRELQRTKISLTDTANLAKSGMAKRVAKDTADAFESNIQEPMRLSLEDAGKWGERAATAQREINANFHDMFNTQGRYRSELFSQGAKDYQTGFRENIAESAKVKGWISSVGTAEGQTRQEIVRNHLASTQNLIDTIGKHYELSPAEAKLLAEAREASDSLGRTLEKVDKTARVANEIDSVFKSQTQGLGQVVGAGAVAGGLVGGLPGALIGGAAGMVLNPGAGIALRSSLEAAAQRFGLNLTRKATGWVKSSAGLVEKPKPVARRGAGVRIPVVPAAVALFQGRHDSLESAYESRVDQLMQAKNDPSYMLDRIAKSQPGLATASPGVAGALQAKAAAAVDFLASKVPSGTISPTPLNPNRKSVVSKLEMTRFAKVWQAVERPESVLDDLQKGTCTPNQIEALRVVHPETYQAVRGAVENAIIEVAAKGKKLPLATRQSLDMLLDLGGAGEPALSPEIADRISSIRESQQKQQPQPKKAPNLTASVSLPQANWPSARG